MGIVEGAGAEGKVVTLDGGEVLKAAAVQLAARVSFWPAPAGGGLGGDDAPTLAAVMPEGLLVRLPEGDFELEFDHGDTQETGGDVVPEFRGNRDAVRGKALVGGEHAIARVHTFIISPA